MKKFFIFLSILTLTGNYIYPAFILQDKKVSYIKRIRGNCNGGNISYVLVYWKIREMNVDHYEIRRAPVNTNNWTTIASINAAGWAMSQEYSYTDNSIQLGQTYKYRLAIYGSWGHVDLRDIGEVYTPPYNADDWKFQAPSFVVETNTPANE